MSGASEAQVQLVFRGEIHDGFSLADVRRHVGHLFGLDEARAAQLFSGDRTVLKRSLPLDEAERYVAVLARAGARVQIEPKGDRSLPLPLAAAGGSISGRASGGAAPAASGPLFELSAPAALAPARLEGMALVPASLPDRPARAFAPSRQDPRSLDAPADAPARSDALVSRRAALEIVARPAQAGALGFGFEGRVNRLKYVTSSLWLLTVLYLAMYSVLQKPDSIVRIVFALVVLALVAYFSARLSVLRCHDCNKTGWWTMLSFVPSVNAIFGLVLSLAPGTEAENDYGEEPAPSSRVWLALAALCTVLVFAITIKSTLRLAERTAAAAPHEDSGEAVTFDARVERLPADARDAFNGRYSSAREHKAFAISGSGAWGMATSAGTVRDAVRDAVSDCDARRAAYTSPCAAVHVDGDWAGGRSSPQPRSRTSR